MPVTLMLFALLDAVVGGTTTGNGAVVGTEIGAGAGGGNGGGAAARAEELPGMGTLGVACLPPFDFLQGQIVLDIPLPHWQNFDLLCPDFLSKNMVLQTFL